MSSRISRWNRHRATCGFAPGFPLPASLALLGPQLCLIPRFHSVTNSGPGSYFPETPFHWRRSVIAHPPAVSRRVSSDRGLTFHNRYRKGGHLRPGRWPHKFAGSVTQRYDCGRVLARIFPLREHVQPNVTKPANGRLGRRQNFEKH